MYQVILKTLIVLAVAALVIIGTSPKRPE
jgi:hypothetical protein